MELKTKLHGCVGDKLILAHMTYDRMYVVTGKLESIRSEMKKTLSFLLRYQCREAGFSL